jgi:hypothetical protein
MFVRVRVSAVVEVELRYGLVPTSNAAEIQIQIQIQNVLHVGASWFGLPVRGAFVEFCAGGHYRLVTPGQAEWFSAWILW